MILPGQTSNQREEEILREIRRAGGSCRISFLASQLGVSNETIRRNLRGLEDKRIVRKVHGGVHLAEALEEPPLQRRMRLRADEKKQLAGAVADTISDGDSVFLDIGSTTAYVAMALRSRSNLFVVTNSLFVAHTLASRNGNRVFLAGGELRPHDGGAFGADALDLIQRMQTRFAVFSIGGVNGNTFMLHDLEEANMARLAAENAQVRIMVADSNKFNTRAPIVLGEDVPVDLFYTNAPPPSTIADMLRRRGTELIVVEPGI